MENTSDVLLIDDQHFLLYLIMGVYFGPDLKEERPRKSALQRLVEGLPQYHPSDLAGSHIKTTVIENVYYYILRKAENPVIVKQPLVLQYIHGVLPLKDPTAYIQFDDLFPPELHQRSQCENQHFTIDNIVLINNPNTDYMNPEVIKRFKRLTGLDDFVLDTKLHVIVEDKVLYNPKLQWTSKLNDTMHLSVQCLETYPDGNNSSMPSSSSLCNEVQVSDSSIMNPVSGKDIDQGMIFLPSCPSMEEWVNLVATTKCGFGLTGSAARGNVGPVIGVRDIGESEDSYLFRVSLPGVRRDESKF